MPLSYFSHQPKQHWEDEIGKSGKYKHTFGGSLFEHGIEIPKASFPLHLIYRLDLSDPAISIDIPDVKFLPLLHAVTYACDCSYRVISDKEIELFDPLDKEHLYVAHEAPDKFPSAPTSFARQPYDPTIAEDALKLKGVFDWEELNKKEKDRALELVKKISHLTVKDGIDETWTYETVIDCMYEPPFVQGSPLERCKNPQCKGSEDDWLLTIAIQNHATVAEGIWGDNSGYVQTIWVMCDKCHSITTLNRCT